MPRNTQPFCLRQRSNDYYYFKLPGWKDYVSAGTQNKAKAMSVVMHAVAEADRTAEGRLSLRAYAEPFYDYDRCPHIQRIGYGITKKSARGMRAYLRNHLLTDALADKVVGDITIRDMTEFRARLEKKKVGKQKKKPRKGEAETVEEGKLLAAETVNKIMAGVKVIMGEAVLNRDIPYNPCIGIARLEPGKNKRGAFTREELLVLFDKKNWRNEEARACFLLDAMTGMRCGEVLAFPWGCYLDDGVLDIVNAWKDTEELGTPKWDKPRAIPASNQTRKLLDWYKKRRKRTAAKDLLFCQEETGGRRDSTWWNKNFAGPMTRSNLPSLDADGRKRTPHSLRHSLNTILLQAGCNPLLVREYLGWSEDGPRMTGVQKGYTHFSVTDMKGVLEVIDGLFYPLVEGEA